jgi:hypothetical protein
MTRREVAFLAIGAGFGGLVGSFAVVYEYGRNIMDIHTLSGLFEAMGINESAFIVPGIILVAGLVLLAARKKSRPISN